MGLAGTDDNIKNEKPEGNRETGKSQKTGSGNITMSKEGIKPDIQADTDNFIYIGPSLGTGIKENAVFTGTRESVEGLLKNTFEKYPQAKILLIPTEGLAKAKSQVKKKGTLLNKYYTDILSLSKGRDRKEKK